MIRQMLAARRWGSGALGLALTVSLLLLASLAAAQYTQTFHPGGRPQSVTQFIADSTGVGGVVTGPGAGINIATTTPVAGTYSVQLLYGFAGGTVTEATERNNFRLVVDGTTVISTLIVPGAANTNQSMTVILTVSGTQAIDLESISAGTGTALYVAQIVLTRIR